MAIGWKVGSDGLRPAMKGGGGSWAELGSWVLTFCAFVTTILVAYSLFLHQPATSAGADPNWQSTYVDDWQDVLDVGFSSGPVTAPIKIVEFADLQCPYCAEYQSVIQEVRERYKGKVSLTLVHFPLPFHEFAEDAALSAECARVQGSFEKMWSALLARQEEFGSIEWVDFANTVGVANLDEFNKCVTEAAPAHRVERAKELALTMGIRATPTILVNGWKMPMPPSPEQFDQVVQNVLEGDPPSESIQWH